MFAASLLFAAQATAVPAPAPYPAIAVLDAFGEACRNISDLEKVETSLIAQEWLAETPPADSPLGKLLATGRSMAADILKKRDYRLSDTSVFTKTVAGERLDIILSRVESDGTFVNGCRLYDVGEERRIDLEAAQKWVGREVDKTLDREELSIANWSPGYSEGHDSFEIYYVPAGSPMIELVKFNGIGLKADFFGEIE